MFNPLVTDRPGFSKSIVVNGASDRPYNVGYTYRARKFVPLSTDGARIPGSTPNGNAFCDVNILAVTNNALVSYHFDLPANQGDLIAYFFADRIMLLAQDGDYRDTYWPADDGAGAAKTARASAQRSHTRLAGSKNGMVFVFNVTPDSIQFSANGGPAPLNAWAPTTNEKPYTPAVLPVDRVLNKSDGLGKIFNGANQIVITPDIASPGYFTLTVTASINQDLFLYLLRDRWLLFDRFGELLDNGPIAPSKSPAAKASARRATTLQPRRR